MLLVVLSMIDEYVIMCVGFFVGVGRKFFDEEFVYFCVVF